MPSGLLIALGLTYATVVAYFATPLAIAVARRIGFYDEPAGGYKLHTLPTPYLGGAAVLAGIVAAMPVLSSDLTRAGLLLGGGAVLWLTGTVDDRQEISPGIRVAIEAAVGAAISLAGYGWDLGLGGTVDLIATVLWVVGVINAFNLIDNMDGVTSVLAIAVCLPIALLAWLQDDHWLAVAATVTSGACLGFLPYNMTRPARIFLGDGGSMLVGFFVAALAVMAASGSGEPWQALTVGTLLVALPLADMLVRIVTRTRRGISVLLGGRDSVTHHARMFLPTARAVAFSLGAAQIVLAGLAVAAARSGTGFVAVGMVAFLALLGTGAALLNGEAEAAAAAPATTRVRIRASLATTVVLAVTVGVLVAAGPWFGGFYDSGKWAPAGLVATSILGGLLTSGRARIGRRAGFVVGALAALAAWALISALWAQNSHDAAVDGDRIGLYAVVLGVLLLLVRAQRDSVAVIGAIAAAVGAVALVEMIRLVGNAPAHLFLAGRLNEPLGYVNGLGAFFLVGFWALLGVAEQRRNAAVAGLGLAAATLCAVLMLLTQSRGVALGALVAAVVVVAAVPGRARRIVALIAVLLPVVFLAGRVQDVYGGGLEGHLDADLAREVGLLGLVLSAVVGLAWGGAVALVGRADRPGARRAAGVAIAVLAVAGLLVAIVNAGRVSTTLRTQYHAFVDLDPGLGGEPTASRLISGSGYRYDYWRAAVVIGRDHPLVGVGAGNYQAPYNLERRTLSDVRQPHSIVLQTFSELGLIGVLLLLAVLATAVAGASVAVRRAATDRTERALCVAGLGMGVAFLVHSSVDWIHLLPGIGLMALVGLAVLMRPGAPIAARIHDRLTARRIVGVGLIGILLATIAVSLTRQALAERYANQAARALAAHPQTALRDANRALRLDGELTSASVTKAAAAARDGDSDAATGALLAAWRRDRPNFVLPALLGDLSVRLGDLDAARRYYRAASARNPREEGLQKLAADPSSAAATP